MRTATTRRQYLTRPVLLALFLTLSAAGTVSRASAEGNNDYYTNAITQIQVCEAMGGKAEVDTYETGRHDNDSNYVKCNGGAMDGFGCGNDRYQTECSFDKHASERHPGSDTRWTLKEDHLDNLSLKPLEEAPPVVVDESSVEVSPVVDVPPVTDPTIEPTPEPTVEVVIEDPVVEDGDVVTEDPVVDEGEIIVEPPVVDDGVVVEDPVVNDGSLDDGGKGPGPSKGDPIDIKPHIEPGDILPVEDVHLT